MSKYLTLKWLRRFIAVIFGLLFLFTFIDFSSTLPPKFINWLIYIQFTPSIIKFLKIGGLLATGFIIVIILTFAFGRVYCSALCPLGIFQDLIARVRLKKPRFKFLIPWNIIRYTTLVVVILSALTSSLFLLNMLDPYSFAGRIFSDLVRPVYYEANNLLVKMFGYFNSYALYNMPFKGMPWEAIAITGSMTLALIVMSWRWGRLFCNSFCPVGALLSLVSRFSIFRIKIDESACTACNRCVRVCKAGCIDVKTNSVDFSRCVACYNCIDSCNENGINYKFAFQRNSKSKKIDVNNSRRNFLSVFAGFIVGGTMVGQAFQTFAQGQRNRNRNKNDAEATKGNEKTASGTKPNTRSGPVSPPGSQSVDNLKNACTACHLCISACPTQVIQPSINEYGFFGILQPHMDFHTGFCNYECTLCGQVCPTGAINPLQLETKKRTQIGIAHFHMGNCIVRTDGTDCGACSEHCPTKAVQMVPWRGLYLPQVNQDICIGCGACEYACPTKPFKAIFVNGNSVHQVADLPEQIDEGPRKWDADEFPF